VRAKKAIPRTNWTNIKSGLNQILGFITYKVGMGSAIVKDNTDKSMTAGKNITIPITILEVPSMKIFAVRFYNKGLPVKDFIVSTEKELKRKVKIPKKVQDIVPPKEYDDIHLIVYSISKTTSIKKTPDLAEIAISADNKLEFVESLIGKELTLDFFKNELIDARGLTKGKGFVGPVKRFGITLKAHKSEKGVRRPGSLAPWHPARVTFRTPMAGQLGNSSRLQYNLKVINSGKISDRDINPKSGFKNYGKIKTSYIIIKGSVQGPSKRQILLTPSFRPTKITKKQKYDFKELAR